MINIIDYHDIIELKIYIINLQINVSDLQFVLSFILFLAIIYLDDIDSIAWTFKLIVST